MSFIDDVMAMDAALFCDPDSMPGGESITYTPFKGSPKTINANVFRLGPRQLVGVSAESYGPSIEIYIPNNTTTGVTSVNINGDKVSLAERQGEAAKVFVVQEIIDQDGGMWHLRIS